MFRTETACLEFKVPPSLEEFAVGTIKVVIPLSRKHGRQQNSSRS